MTAELKATPDGRPSAAKIRRSASFHASLDRLAELWTEIGGPAVTSLDGLVQDCTEACYRDSVEFWAGEIPAEYQARGNPPTAAQATYVRGLLWFGKPIRTAFDAAIKRTSNDLVAALGAAGSTTATGKQGIQSLAAPGRHSPAPG